MNAKINETAEQALDIKCFEMEIHDLLLDLSDVSKVTDHRVREGGTSYLMQSLRHKLQSFVDLKQFEPKCSPSDDTDCPF
jgi:hypothetical protein